MKQGYNDRLDESIGGRDKGPKKQSMKDRRDESKAMSKKCTDTLMEQIAECRIDTKFQLTYTT